VSAILEAAAEVFAEKGYGGATTNKIAVRAGVSIGSLYQYFPNKDAILAGLMERHQADVRAVVEQSMEELDDTAVPIRVALGSLLRGLVDLHAENPKLTHALSDEVVPAHLVHRDREEHYAIETERVLGRRSDVRSGDTRMMAHIVVQTVETLTRWYVHEAPPYLEEDHFIDEALRLLTRYIQVK
jgi:AcrR family transcriptional regulator